MHPPFDRKRVYMCRLEADDLSGGRTSVWLAGHTVAVWYWAEVLYREHLKHDRHPEMARRALSWPDPSNLDEVIENDHDDIPF
jgi:hypothetical protein